MRNQSTARAWGKAACLFLWVVAAVSVPGGNAFGTTNPYREALEHYRAGEYAKTIDSLMKKERKNAGDRNLLGWAFLNLGNPAEAATQFHASLELDPDLYDSYCGLGYTHLRSESFSAAKENFLRALPRERHNADCLLGLGIALEKLGETGEAIRAFREVLAVSPNHPVAAERIRILENPPPEPVDVPYYEEAVSSYGKGDYDATISTLLKALEARPEFTPALVLLGWSYHRSGRNDLAVESFRRAVAASPENKEAHLGLAYSSLGADDPGTALPILKRMSVRHPKDRELQLALAEAYFQTGDNLAAARTYRTLAVNGGGDAEAGKRFLQIFGFPEDEEGRIAEILPASRPDFLTMNFRAKGDFFEVRTREGWRKTYLKGVNIGPARPGEFPSTPPLDAETYLDWLEQIARMNANTVRVYTILPPAFYQALKRHNDRSPTKLWLIQEVWLEEREDVKDLYSPSWTEDFRNEIRYAVDLIHGRADIPYRRGHSAGIYTADVSPYTIALGLGREVESSVVLATNAANPKRTRYKGTFVGVPSGNPSETWFAEKVEYAILYETETYNCQRPLTVFNWPPLDPMYHVTEASYREEVRIRRKRGEQVSEFVPDTVNDSDAVSLDITAFRTTPAFAAGLFATYHVYPYWPDFLIYDPEYPKARDHEGPNRYFGYLLDLKKHHPGIPLLIGEYGLPTSWGVAHIHPEGWSNGGLTEADQAAALTRMTRNIRDAGCAGGLVFEWQDEWWKRVSDYFTRPFSLPAERKPLWLNMLDPEQSFGILGYRSQGTTPLLRGEPSDWDRGTLLSTARSSRDLQTGAPKRVYAFSDAAFLYLRLDVEAGAGKVPSIDWDRSQYWFALSTLPGEAGSRRLPEIPLSVGTGANFLIRLSGPDSSRILIAENYNPNRWVEQPAVSWKRLWRKQGMKVAMKDRSPFREILTEANQPRYGRDGTVFPPRLHNRSPLKYGTADRSSPAYDSDACWHADGSTGMIEIRIPWGLLNFTDPSSRRIVGGTDEKRDPLVRETAGIAVAVAQVPLSGKRRIRPGGAFDTLPEASRGEMAKNTIPIYTWEPWNRVRYEPYRKESYEALRKIFGSIRPPEVPAAVKNGKVLQ